MMTGNKEKLVIVGNGMAGGKLVEELVANCDNCHQITIIGDEPCGNYNRIKLVGKLKDPDLPEFFINDPQWYADHGVEAILGATAQAIHREEKQVELADGRMIPYDKLVLATGAHPFIPPMDGLDLPGVFTLRKLRDVESIRNFLKDRSAVMVLGGGLLGIELALMLRLLGKRVTVSHLMPSLMELQLPEGAGHFLKHHLEDLGIRFVMGTYVTELLGTTAGVERARFKDGASIETEAVFFNCGIRPNKDLAEAAGLVFNRGIAVNDRLQTSDPHIYACGECIEFKGQTWGLVAPVYEHSRALAEILCGKGTTFQPSAPAPTRLKSDIPVLSMGRFKPEAGDEVVSYSDPSGAVFKQMILEDGFLKGAVLVGEDLNAESIELHYTARLPAPTRRADLLFPGATAGDAILDGSGIPDEARICDCNGISAAQIRTSIRDGNDTLFKVMRSTKAGTGCGNCKNKLKSLLIAEVGELRVDPAENYYVPGVALNREELSHFIRTNNLRSVSDVLQTVPNAVDDSATRIGLDYLLNYLWLSKHTLEDDARTANDRYAGNIQNDGRFSVIPDIPGGVATPRHLRAIADVADRYNARIKVTGADRIGLYSINKEDLPKVWDELHMACGFAYTKGFRACKSCVGKTFCRFGLMDSLSLGERLGKRYRGLMSPAKLKMGVSGCPRNCAESTIKDFGVVAVEGGWDVFVGGNGGAKVYVAHKIAQVKTDEEVIQLADRFFEYYRRHAKYGERTAHFIERVGLKPVADAILHAPAEDLAELESRLAQALENIVDPWESRTADYTSNLGSSESPAPAPAGFVRVATLADIPPGGARRYEIAGRAIAVFHHRDGSWLATAALCPHERGPLVDGTWAGGRLVCPLHGYSFDTSTGVGDNPDIPPLQIYRHQVRDDAIWVELT